MENDKQLELEALAAVGEMLLFDAARGKPEEAQRILRCATLFARSKSVLQRLSALCADAGSNMTWHEKTVEELQDREDLQAAEMVMQRIQSGDEQAVPVEDVVASLDAGYAAQAQAEKSDDEGKRGEAAKVRGVKFGPNPTLTAAQIDHARELVDQGERQKEGPTFLDDQGPMEPPAHVSTVRLHDILAGLSDADLAAWPVRLAAEEAERRRVKS